MRASWNADMNRAPIILILLILATNACSSATIYRHGAPDLEATLVGGNEQYLYVETDDDRVVRIERKKVTEIDHPGNIAAAIGGGLSLLGGGLVYLGATGQPGLEGNGYLTAIGAIFLIPGVITLASGMITWGRSAAAANERDLQLAPMSQIRGRSGLPDGIPRTDGVNLPLQATLVSPP